MKIATKHDAVTGFGDCTDSDADGELILATGGFDICSADRLLSLVTRV